MTNPLISIIVPVFNNQQYLAECIDSILAQAYPNIQLILVDDGSTDCSLSICESYLRRDDRVLLISQENKGVSAARNAGIQAANGDYIAFVDSDDFVDSQIYNKLIRIIVEDASDCAVLLPYSVRSPSFYLSNSGRILGSVEAIRELFLLRFPTSMWAYLYKAEFVKGLMVSEDVHFFEDFEFNLNFLRRSSKVSLCNEELYFYRVNPVGANGQELNYKRLSCFLVHERCLSYLSSSEKEVKENFLFFKAHCLLSVVLAYARSSAGVRKVFKGEVKAKVFSALKELVFSSRVPFSYKVLLVVFLLNSRLVGLMFTGAKRLAR